MAINQVQIQPGLSLFEFVQRYGTETQCEQALAEGLCLPGLSLPTIYYVPARRPWYLAAPAMSSSDQYHGGHDL